MTPPPFVADCVVAFDTSTEHLAVGLSVAGRRWTRDLPGGAVASVALLPTLQALLGEAGRVLQQVAALGFGRGPGAFTGLRTSCAVAQGLAFGLGRPVLPIDSLLIVAEQARRQAAAADGFDIGVAMDARMGEAYAARYRYDAGTWHTLESPALWVPEALAAAWTASPPTAGAGTGLAAFDAALRQVVPLAHRIVVGEDRAGALLHLAEGAWRSGAGVPAEQALPLYLREKVALTSAERARAMAPNQP